ncbi:hypothetical protein GCM10022221_36480 [Actinocorallia aurea]
MSEELKWFKSSRSQGHQTDCVEVAFGEGDRHFRDSKAAEGEVLTVGREVYRAFVAALKAR